MERLGQLMQADDQQLQDESQQGSLEIDEGEKEDPKLDPLEEREEEKQCETTNSKMLAQLKEVIICIDKYKVLDKSISREESRSLAWCPDGGWSLAWCPDGD